MAYTYHELKEKTVQDLREIAKTVEKHDAVQGYSQMNKEHLLPALCRALGIDTHEVLEAMMEVRGKRKPLVHVPAVLPKLAGFFLQALPKPPLSPDAVDFLTGDALADTGPLLRAFQGLRLTPLREGLTRYLVP